MEQLKRLAEICRQHYEKIILIVVLLLMAVAAYVMWGQSQEKREEVRQKPKIFETFKVKGVTPVDMQPIEKAIKDASTPPSVSLGGKHNLFNPVRWVQYPGRDRIKVDTETNLGPSQIEIVTIRPLLLTISWDKPSTSGSGEQLVVLSHQISVTNDLATPRRRTQFLSVGETNKHVLILTEVKGDPKMPTEVVARLKDFNGETISFAPGKPYVRVIGHEADLKYVPGSATFNNKRKDSSIVLEGETYNIVDITENTVVLSDKSNGKRTTIRQTTPRP